MIQRHAHFPGLLLTLAFALVATWLGKTLSFSAALIALILGVAAGVLLNRYNKKQAVFSPGFSWSERQGLGLAIALMGFQMPWDALLSSGWQVLLLVILGLIFTFVVTYFLSKLFRLSRSQSLLMATGNGICGSAAVMATQSVIKSNRADTAIVVTLVNVLGLLGMVISPLIVVQFFHGQDFAAGQLIGNTLQSMPHVVAAGFSVNDDVAQTAVWVKMVRILMLLPVLFVLAWWQHRSEVKQNEQHKSLPWLALVPVFIWGFMACACINLLWPLPVVLLKITEQVSDVLMCMALVAIGAQIQWQTIQQSGGRLLVMGLLLFALQLSFSGFLISHF